MSGYPLLHPGLTPAQHWLDQGHLWTQTSGCPLLHPGLTPAQDWSDQGASLDSEEWVSTPPSWSDGLYHYWSDQGHLWTQKSGCPRLHPDLMACTTTGPTRGMSGLR